MTGPAREEDASVGSIRYRAAHQGYDVDFTCWAMLAARTLDRENAIRGPLADLPEGHGPFAVRVFETVLPCPIETTLPRLLNAIGDEGTAKTILGGIFQTRRLLSCLAYVRAGGDCVVDVETVLSKTHVGEVSAHRIHVRGRDWRIALQGMHPRSEAMGAVRLG